MASPIPGSVANCSVDAMLMLIPFSVFLIDGSCATFRLGSLTHPGLKICATMTSVITAVRALAMRRICFTYASECSGLVYAIAARVCTLLEVQHFQKLRLFYAALSTDFSTAAVENVPKESRRETT